MFGLTNSAARFVADLRFSNLPSGAVDVAIRGITDCSAVILLGIDEPITAIVAQGAPRGGSEATALWGKICTTADYAALLNATSAHSLDYDDTSGESHPSAVLFPAILAVGEPFANGEGALSAYIAGYEVWTELASRDRDKHHSKGFHPSGIFGAIGAAAACANLLRLDVNQASAAMAIAASMSAGLVANFGTMTKPFQLGRAAQSGVIAAQMAARGMTAGADVLEHPRGFLAAYSPAAEVDLESSAAFGRSWRCLSEGLNIKLYPVCYAAHRLINSAVALRDGLADRADAIREIRVFLGRTQSQILYYRSPRDSLEAKFSVEFATAAALLSGQVGLGELNESFLCRQDVRELMARVVRIESDKTDPEQTLFSPADRVEIEFLDGKVISGPPIRFAPGHAHNPVDQSKLTEKFEDCTAGKLDVPRRDRLLAMLTSLQDLNKISDLYEI